VMSRSGKDPVYACRRVLDGSLDEVQPNICGEPSVFDARDNRAVAGHLCEACWKAQPADVQSLYALRRPVVGDTPVVTHYVNGNWKGRAS
jgi:hypothetical protein